MLKIRDDFNSLADIHLLKCPDTKTLPQIIVSNMDKRTILWMPGKNKVTLDKFKSLDFHNHYLYGFNGVYYPSYNKTMSNQDRETHWLGIDIDLDNPQDTDMTYNKILKAMEGKAIIRLSTNGNGFHLIIRFSKPIKNLSRNGQRIILQPFLDNLKKLDVKVCCFGQVLYLFGKKQKTLYFPDTRLDITEDLLSSLPTNDSFNLNLLLDLNNPEPKSQKNQDTFRRCNSLLSKKLSKDGANLLNILASHGVYLNEGKTDIYVKKIYNILLDTPYSFDTASPMKSEYEHTNGFFYYEAGLLKLWTAADGCFVFTRYLL